MFIKSPDAGASGSSASAPTPKEGNPAPAQESGNPNPNPTPTSPKTYSDEELNRAKQSASSSAKNEILKELGITSVDEGKTLIQAKTTLEQKVAKMETDVEDIKKVANTEHQNAVMTSLGVSSDHLSDLRILALAKVGDGKDFAVIAKEVLDANPQWKATAVVPKPEIGGHSQGGQPNPQGGSNPALASDSLKSKYPWLK